MVVRFRRGFIEIPADSQIEREPRFQLKGVLEIRTVFMIALPVLPECEYRPHRNKRNAQESAGESVATTKHWYDGLACAAAAGEVIKDICTARESGLFEVELAEMGNNSRLERMASFDEGE